MKHSGWKRAAAALLVILLMVVAIPCRAMAANSTEVLKIKYMIASYRGATLPVGAQIPKEDLLVTVVYEDGTAEDIRDYTLSQTTITKEGINRIQAVYQGKTADIYITGKKASQLYVSYQGGAVSVGNSVGKDNLMVFAFFSDGSFEEVTDYQIGNSVITAVGEQRVYVIYDGLTAYTTVLGTAPKQVSSLVAYYNGPKVVLGNEVPEENLSVTAVYSDGTTERIYNYTLTPKTITDLGTNKVIVFFRGATAEISVEGVVKTLESITAKYSGEKVEVGEYVDAAEIEVTAHYNDGTTEKVEDFSLLSSRILLLGNNRVTVSYRDMRAEIVVQGIEKKEVSYANAASFTVKNLTRKASVQIALPKRLSRDTLTGKSLKPAKVAGVLGKLDEKVIDYIAFDVILADETQDDIFPLTMQIKLPSYYKADQTHLYYSSNRRTVIARMNAEYVKSGIMEVTIFHAGTYILAYQELPEEDEPESGEDDYL